MKKRRGEGLGPARPLPDSTSCGGERLLHGQGQKTEGEKRKRQGADGGYIGASGRRRFFACWSAVRYVRFGDARFGWYQIVQASLT